MPEKRKRRKKKQYDLRRILTIFGSIAAVLFITILLIPAEKGYDEFLDALGFRESTDNYALVNSYGYMGRYQMGGMALKEAGFKDADGAWTALANSYGVYSKDDFLHSPDAQNIAVAAYHTKVCSYIRAYRLDRYIGSTYCGVEVTRSGLLAACHLVGVGSLKKALASGTHAYDGNRTTASEYMKKFGGYDISQVWGE